MMTKLRMTRAVTLKWDSTDKHRVLFVIKKTSLQKLVGPESAEARRNMCFWRGEIHEERLAVQQPS